MSFDVFWQWDRTHIITANVDWQWHVQLTYEDHKIVNPHSFMPSMSKSNVISFHTRECNAILMLWESRYRFVTKHDYIVRCRLSDVWIADVVSVEIDC